MKYIKLFPVLTLSILSLLGLFISGVGFAQSPQSGSVGLQGTVAAPPPTQPATISVPTNGQTFSDSQVTVSGICPNGLLVKLFKNNVFSGSDQCQNGSYEIIIDLFTGRNDLVARVYDDLDQAGPDSNVVSVTFNSSGNSSALDRVTLTSNYAKLGANPGSVLSWPIVISGGVGPYAISVDWGDGKTDLLTREFPGEFLINHTYESAGVYRVIIKAVDKNGTVGFLQLVAIGNGPISQENNNGSTTTTGSGSGSGGSGAAAEGEVKILWQPAAIMLPFIVSTFWLGKRYELKRIRHRIIKGQRPF